MKCFPKMYTAMAMGLAAALGTCSLAQALTITPVFDSGITTNPNAAYFEGQIDNAIATVDSYIANPVSITINFYGQTFGLGSSSSQGISLTYSQYLGYLNTKQTLSASDNIALASLPAGPYNPVPVGNITNTGMRLNQPLLEAFGYSPSDSGGSGASGDVYLNVNYMMLPGNTTTQNVGLYSMQSVAAHEIDEVLNIGGQGSNLNNIQYYPPGYAIDNYIGPMDLYRYSAPGVRSFTTSGTATSYFSINGGTTDLVHFNQNSAGDYGDWGSTGQVQSAVGTTGKVLNLGANELTALDVVGWNLTPLGTAVETGVPIPEPAALGLLVTGTLGLLLGRKRKSA